MGKTIITVAPTGSFPTLEDNPNIPMTPQAIADEVYDCWNAGAAIAHIHMRDDNGVGTMNVERFVETVRRIRDRCDIVINCATNGELNATDNTRMAHLQWVRPEMATCCCGTMNWLNKRVFTNHPQFLEKLCRTMLELNIKTEIEIFDVGMVYNSIHYRDMGLLRPPLHYQFMMGFDGGIAATVENLVYLKSIIPPGSTWSALGKHDMRVPIMLATAAMGGHLRVGMEDTIHYIHNKLAESNAQLVTRAADIVRTAGGVVASPDDAREILNLKLAPKQATPLLS